MPSNSSYIDANILSPKELADKIKKLSDDEHGYNNFFEFKKKPLPDHFVDITLMSYVSFMIYLKHSFHIFIKLCYASSSYRLIQTCYVVYVRED